MASKSKQQAVLQAQEDFLDKFRRSSIHKNTPLGDRWRIFTIKFWKTAVVNPTGTFFFYWSMVNMLAVFYNNAFLVLRGVFSQAHDRFHSIWIVFDYLADVIFIMDMAIRSRKAFLEHGLLVQDVRRLLKNYLKSYMFFVDCVTIVPAQFFMGQFHTHDYRYRLNRCGRIRRMFHFFHMAETRFPTFARLVNLIIYIIFLIHFNACIFFAICKSIGLGTDGWVYPAAYGDTELDPAVLNDFWQQYLYSFYWSTLTLTTIGDTPYPETTLELLYCTICCMVGVLLFATVFGNVGKLVNEMSIKRTEYQNKVESVKEYMDNKQIPAKMQAKIMKWFQYVWKHSQIADDADILKQLPEKMQAEMGVCVHIDTLRNVRLFQDCEAGFLEELVLKLKLEVFSPGDFICRKGDIGREMFIIKRGYLHVMSEDGTVLAKLAEGQMFGEVSVLDIPGNVMHNRRLADVTAVGYVDLLSLSKSDIWRALEEYPNAKRILLEKGKSYLRRDKAKYIVPVEPTEKGPDKRELLEQLKREAHENVELVQKRDGMLDEQIDRQKEIKSRFKRIEELLTITAPIIVNSGVENSVPVFTCIEIIENIIIEETIGIQLENIGTNEDVEEDAGIKLESIDISGQTTTKGQSNRATESDGGCKLQTSVTDTDNQSVSERNEQLPIQDGAVSRNEQLPKQDGAVSRNEQLPKQDGAMSWNEQLPKQDGAVSRNEQLPKQDGAVSRIEQLPKHDVAVSVSIADLIENDIKVKESNLDPHLPDKDQSIALESNRSTWKNGTQTQTTKTRIAPETDTCMKYRVNVDTCRDEITRTEVTANKSSAHDLIPTAYVSSRVAQIYQNEAGLNPTPVPSTTCNYQRPSKDTGWSLIDSGKYIPRSKIDQQQSTANVGSSHGPVTKFDEQLPKPGSTSGWAIGERVKPSYFTSYGTGTLFNAGPNTTSAWFTDTPTVWQDTRTGGGANTTAATKHTVKDGGVTRKQFMPVPDTKEQTCANVVDSRKSTNKERGDCRRHTKKEVGVQVQLRQPVNKAQPVLMTHRNAAWKPAYGTSHAPDVRRHTSNSDKHASNVPLNTNYQDTGLNNNPENLDADFGHLVIEM